MLFFVGFEFIIYNITQIEKKNNITYIFRQVEFDKKKIM